ncbi:hypothetical protein JAAARDRAFT_48939 [Jaapia argillacea MUCL 33604]|uniref:Uncharacterized protein n=1 Tax=Jaapia argillacea MUCL 33604 TaxID=933084 RepID=A0A067PK77_9AGAM|nr:hypothetical protein JAAARDRAFT_48939 [Jaapia argillacea MUCL 33604]
MAKEPSYEKFGLRDSSELPSVLEQRFPKGEGSLQKPLTKRKRSLPKVQESEGEGPLQLSISDFCIPRRMKQAMLDDMKWKVLNVEEKCSELGQGWEETRERMQEAREREEMQKVLRAKQKRENARLRQKRFRARRAQERQKQPPKKTVLVGDGAGDKSQDVAEVSRLGLTYKKKRNGKRGGTIQQRHSRTNWYHPFLWAHIDQIAPKVEIKTKLTQLQKAGVPVSAFLSRSISESKILIC